MAVLNTFSTISRLFGLTACTMLIAGTAYAKAADPQVEGAKLCTKQIPIFERQHSIPQHLLAAISSTESGRWHDGLNIVLPWPWTINAEGKGYYYNSKQEAIIAARNFQSRGVKSMDVGCMQVNLMHHSTAFRNLEEAFDPQHNVAYAASFLRDLYQTEGTWRKAAAAYHSKTPARGSQYVARVFSSWTKIMDRLNMAKTAIAKADIPASGVKTTKPQARVKSLASLASSPAREPVKMKVIEVSNANKKKDNIFVLRPDYTTNVKATEEEAKPLTVASIEKTVALAPNSKVIYLGSHVGNGIKKIVPDTPASGPRFIFSD